MTVCRACGTAFASAANGVGPLCLGCLLDSALGGGSSASAEPGNDAPEPLPVNGVPLVAGRFDHYELATREDGTFVELGRGGMGITYRATDTTLHCVVALKVVNPAFARDPRARVRFLREARAAAGLRHPHVASVFFFGERADDGQLFYAMELVEGETLQARVRRSGGLPIDQVLEIGTQVTDALAAAEARGLTHRDLKPANLMLVDGEAVNVKIIDFGLAKAVADEAPDGSHLTRTQEFVGTPAFASPEQGNVWQEVGLHSDFYALGATLWFALTGQPPFAGRTAGEMRARQLRAALSLEPLVAARVPAPVAELLRALLSPEPADRPQTAQALAEALAGCRQTPPAVPPRRGVGRHARRILLPAAVSGAMALAAGWWVTSHHATNDIARQNALLQRQATAQQQQLDAVQDQLKQQTQLIALVNAKIDRNAPTTQDHASGSNPAAFAQAEIARERGISVETLQKQLADEQGDVRRLLTLIDQRLMDAEAQTTQWRQLKRVTLTRLGDSESAAGHYLAAVEPYQQALTLIHTEQEPLAWCDAAGHLVAALLQSARFAEAAPLAQQVVDRRVTLLGPEHPDTLKALRAQAALFYDQGDLARAEAQYRRVLETQERTLGKEDRETLKTLATLSRVPIERGRNAESETLGRRCLEACERTLGKEDLLTLEAVNNLAVTLYTEGRFAEAAALDRRLLEARERLLGAEHPLTLMAADNLANALLDQGDVAGAEPFFRHALAAEERTLGPDHPATLHATNNLARLLQAKGDLVGAEAFYRRAWEGHAHLQGADHPDTLSTLNNLANALQAQGNLAAAEPLFRQALERYERTLGADHSSTLMVVNNLAILLQARGDLVGAEPLFRRAWQGQERALGPDHPDTLSALSNLAQMLDAKGDIAAAEPLYEQAQARMERVLSPQDPYRLDLEHYFSLFREAQGRLTEALALAKQVIENCKNLRAGSTLRRTYEAHYQTLQAKVNAPQSPTPAPARKVSGSIR